MTRDYKKQCWIKRAIKTKEKARARALHARQRTGQKIEEYFCPHCNFWHIGHKIKNQN